MSEVTRKVYYNSCADEQVYGMIREVMPAGFELVALEKDDDEERKRRLADARVAIVAATPLTAPLLEAAEKLELVCHQGVGYQDTVAVDVLRQRGIPLALTPEGTTTPVAEMTILLILAVYRRLTFTDPELRQGRWHINSQRPVSRNLSGRVVGYVGMGRIGQATARIAHAFGAAGIYCDVAETLGKEDELAIGLRRGSFDEVIEQADIVSLHIPSGPENKHMINAGVLARMKPGAVLVNTARGSLVDEAALIEALKSGHLGGAGLDVYEAEPPSTDNPLLAMPNVALTPHIAGGTRDAYQTKMRAIFDNVTRFYAGEPLNNPVVL